MSVRKLQELVVDLAQRLESAKAKSLEAYSRVDALTDQLRDSQDLNSELESEIDSAYESNRILTKRIADRDAVIEFLWPTARTP